MLSPVNLAGDIFLNFVLSAAVEVKALLVLDSDNDLVRKPSDFLGEKLHPNCLHHTTPCPNLVISTPDARCGGGHDWDGLHWQGLPSRHLPTYWWNQVFANFDQQNDANAADKLLPMLMHQLNC